MRAAAGALGLHPDAPAVVLDDPAREREAEAGALVPRVEPVEQLEHPLAVRRVDADAVVAHEDLHEAVACEARLPIQTLGSSCSPVNLAALSSRFCSSSTSRCGSPCTLGSGPSTSTRTPRAAEPALDQPARLAHDLEQRHVRVRRSMRPVRDSSSRSSSSRPMRSVAPRIRSMSALSAQVAGRASRST